ncbi:MAG: hypothetical protein M5U34_02095 [Chloroflexi bacterium]|nr:hypothetical protein [Chloroflexota bacterium]
MLKKILWLLNNQAEAEAMGHHARQKTMSEQTIERHTAFLESIYVDAALFG